MRITKAVYIAGKVTGEPISQCTMKFGAAQKKWEQKGYEVMNPLALVNDFKATWTNAMRICIVALAQASEAYFLSDWQESRGARLEHEIAKALGIPIWYEDEKSINSVKPIVSSHEETKKTFQNISGKLN